MPRILVFSVAILLTTFQFNPLSCADEDQLTTIVEFQEHRDEIDARYEMDLTRLLEPEDGFLCPAVT